MMKNKGFVLMETIVVIVLISVTLLTIFSSYNKILRKVKTENKYDTSEYIYITKYIKDNLNTLCNNKSITLYNPINVSNITSSNINSYEYSDCLDNNIFNIKKIYLLKGLDNVGEYAENFDAYIIDYLRKLDIDSKDELIIIEYKKHFKDSNYNSKSMLTNASISDKNLYETYIASLRW